MNIENALNYRQEIIALLGSVKLPTEDLPEQLDNFLAMRNGDHLIGVAGIEKYGRYALLRSVAVSPGSRDKGIAGKLLSAIEERAASAGITAVYLLTETAPDYFSGRGYQKVERHAVPLEVRQSSEFSHVCPQSATAMRKVIAANQ